jgi:hypothetical protein
MIGAKGLLGKSWPDLDMLPLGWLTDPGYNLHSVFSSYRNEEVFYRSYNLLYTTQKCHSGIQKNFN